MGHDERLVRSAAVSLHLCCDLDGTLLDGRQRVVPSGGMALQRLRDEGGVVVLATGRSERAVAPVADGLGLLGPAILYNGCRVVELGTGRVLHEVRLPAIQSRSVAAAVGALDDRFLPVCFADGVATTDRDGPVARAYAAKDGIPLHRVDRWDRLPAATKWLVVCPHEEVADTARLLAGAAPGCNVVQSEATYLEVLPPGVDKGSALRWLMARHGLSRRHVAAVGDHLNDLPLLAEAGLAMAVGDGHPRVQAAADRIVAGCRDGAVAEAVGLARRWHGGAVAGGVAGGPDGGGRW